MKPFKSLILALAVVFAPSLAFAQANPANLPAVTLPLTGNELLLCYQPTTSGWVYKQCTTGNMTSGGTIGPLTVTGGLTPSGYASVFGPVALYSYTTGRNSTILAYALNSAAASTNALPAALNGLGRVTSTGNQVFGAYGLGVNDAPNGVGLGGVAIGAEFTERNNCGSPDTALPPNTAIGTTTCVGNGVQITSGGTYGGSVGLEFGNEGGSSVSFNTEIYMQQFLTYGLFIDSVSTGTQTDIVAKNNGAGINLHMQTTGALVAANTVADYQRAESSYGYYLKQNGNVYYDGVVTGNGGFKSGANVGVTCSGAPTGSFAVTNGIVTHC